MTENTEPIQVRLISPDRISTEPVAVTLLSENRLRLEEPFVMCAEVGLYDIVETEKEANGSYRIVRVVEPAGFRRYEYSVGGGLESERVQHVLERVQSLGGQWAAALGHVVINLPPDCTYDPGEDLKNPAGS